MATSLINAIQVHAYGAADQLRLEQMPRPEPGAGEVLVRVHAAGVNPVDWKLRSGMVQTFSQPPSPMCQALTSPG